LDEMHSKESRLTKHAAYAAPPCAPARNRPGKCYHNRPNGVAIAVEWIAWLNRLASLRYLRNFE